MIERETAIETRHGVMPTWIVHPGEEGPFPMVLFLMDALGIREELRDMCRRIASVGYAVYLPNLYYRDGCVSFDPATLASGWMDPTMVKLNNGLSTDMSSSDCRAVLEHAAANAQVKFPAAVIGYCMGGRHAIAAAAHHPQQVKAMASMHGGQLVSDSPKSPHLLIARMEAEAYFAWAQDDPVAPAAHAEIVKAALASTGHPHRVEFHAALHGFTFPQRYCYDQPAAEQVWFRLFSLFRRNLHPTAGGAHGGA